MTRFSPRFDTLTSGQAAPELCLRIGKQIFGISFPSLAEARDAAHQIILSGREVEIYERESGKILESSKAVSVTGSPREFFADDDAASMATNLHTSP